MTEIRCPFCNPAIVASTIAESTTMRALYNIAPMLPGHCLVIPRRHVRHLADLSSEEGAALWEMAAQVANAAMRLYGGTGFDLSLQEGAAAGQTVPHLHLHVIPRHEGDLTGRDWHSVLIDSVSRPPLTPEEMALQVTRLRRALAAR
ncbi:MAG: HIT family protein [Anaerolineae bacterium]|jgi:bis(5'-adenosyl)-triphosphatase|nr:HIT family protein [Chloroflexota bacterium]